MKLKYTIAALAATTLAANAAVVVSTIRGGTGDQAEFIGNSGQTFTTAILTENKLTSIEFIGPSTAPATGSLGPFTVKLWTDIDNDATTWDPGTEVAVSTNLVTIPGANGAFSALFSNQVLSDNTVYTLSFTTDNGLVTQVDHAAFRMGLTAANNPLGSTGKLFYNTGNPPFGDNREIAFTVNTAIPEPSSTALLGLGGLALILRRRK